MSNVPAAPPAQRKVVVLRQGPPKHRSFVVDALAGVVGVALLVFAGVLGETLPEPDFVPIQYQTEFPTTSAEAPITYDGEVYPVSVLFTSTTLGPTVEQQEYVLEFEVVHDNVYQVRVQAFTDGDDVPGSGSDSWRFTLYDREGNQPASQPKILETKMAKVRSAEVIANSTNPRVLTDPVPSLLNEAWRWTSAPDPELIDGNNLTRQEAQLLASQRYTIDTKGTWKIVMRANPAGDCPSGAPPATDQTAMQLYIACYDTADSSNAADPGQDYGNPLIIRGISYDYYEINIMED